MSSMSVEREGRWEAKGEVSRAEVVGLQAGGSAMCLLCRGEHRAKRRTGRRGQVGIKG